MAPDFVRGLRAPATANAFPMNPNFKERHEMRWNETSRSSVTEHLWADQLALSTQFVESSAKLTYAPGFDGLGDKLTDTTPSPALITVDPVPDDTSSTATPEVHGAPVPSTIQ